MEEYLFHRLNDAGNLLDLDGEVVYRRDNDCELCDKHVCSIPVVNNKSSHSSLKLAFDTDLHVSILEDKNWEILIYSCT